MRRGVADDMIFMPQSNRGDAAESLADEFTKAVKLNGVSHRGYLFDEADKSPRLTYTRMGDDPKSDDGDGAAARAAGLIHHPEL